MAPSITPGTTVNDDTNLPEDDRDRKLARRIGEGLEDGTLEGAEPAEADERYFDALLAMKRRAKKDRDLPAEDVSRRVWARIDDATREDADRVDDATRERPVRSDKPARERPVRLDRPPADHTPLTPRWVWASIAATLLIGGLIAVLTLRGPDATLVATADAETMEYTAPDGSVITLRPHSNLYAVDESGTRYRLDGEAFFAVTARDEGTFAVEAGEAVVEVLGTRFNLSTWGGSAAVYLEEGRIRFAHVSTGDEVILEPGQSSRLTTEGGVREPEAERAGEHLDWLSGEMQFQQQPVALVAAELAQHFGLDLEIPEPVRGETLSGRILLGDAGQSLEDLGSVMGGRFVPTDPNAYRFEPE